MNYETIFYDLSAGQAVITLNRPEVMNALNTQMRAEITHAVKRGADEAKAVVLTGEGRAFCSGQELGGSESAADLNLERILRDEYEPMLRSIFECPVPVISAVNGPAAGAGANLALAADVVIAAESAYFLQAFTRIGLMPDAGGTYFLPRQIGMARAKGAALFAEPVSATQAEAWGMIWEAVPDQDFVTHWQNRAAQLAAGPTFAYERIKRAMGESIDNDLNEQLVLEAKLQGECGSSRDFREGLIAFSEKRAPSFEGR